MGFRALRVINEDRVAPAQGFGAHGHRDMEIITYVLEGALEHKDSMGNGSIIRPGDVQRMSAGTGVRHSELNPSQDELVHFLQIWILPERAGMPPSYEQRSFSPEEKRGTLRLIASKDGRNGAVTVHQDVNLYAALLAPNEVVRHELSPGRHAWLHVVSGEVELDGQRLSTGDAAGISDAGTLEVGAARDAELLLFDLA
jgi:redox-sensitive bicupin YhaK (pirin superfamily)